jgi:hypothetical protein
MPPLLRVVMLRTVASAIGVFCLSCLPLFAQEGARSVNPEAIQFDPPQGDQPPGTEYRVEFFNASADIHADRPVRSIGLHPLMLLDDGSLRVDLHSALVDVPDGEYIATLRAFGDNGPVDVSEPSQPFVLFRAALILHEAELTQREKFWTKIGFAIIGGILVVPFLVR